MRLVWPVAEFLRETSGLALLFRFRFGRLLGRGGGGGHLLLRGLLALHEFLLLVSVGR